MAGLSDTSVCPGAGPVSLDFTVADFEQNPNVVTFTGSSSNTGGHSEREHHVFGYGTQPYGIVYRGTGAGRHRYHYRNRQRRPTRQQYVLGHVYRNLGRYRTARGALPRRAGATGCHRLGQHHTAAGGCGLYRQLPVGPADGVTIPIQLCGCGHAQPYV